MAKPSKLEQLTEKARPHLEPGERIDAVIIGGYEGKLLGGDAVRTGILIATDRRLFFYASKMFSGYESESFPYPNISSFERGKNTRGCHIRFFASGNQVGMKWIAEDEAFARFTELMAQRAGHKPAGQPAPAAAGQGGPLDTLRQLGELRDSGVLTPQEFEAQKAKLLDQI